MYCTVQSLRERRFRNTGRVYGKQGPHDSLVTPMAEPIECKRHASHMLGTIHEEMSGLMKYEQPLSGAAAAGLTDTSRFIIPIALRQVA
jgi:hypothetical protein